MPQNPTESAPADVNGPAEPVSAPLGGTADATRGLARKVTVAALLGAAIFAALALYSDIPKLREAAGTFSGQAFGLGLMLAAGNYVLRIARWQYYLGLLGVRIPWLESSLVFLTGFVMSVTPGKIGEVLKSLLLYETRGISFTRTAPIVIAERLTDLIALVLLTAVGALAFEHGVVIALGGAAIVAVLLVVCAYKPLGHFLLRIAHRLPVIHRITDKLWIAYDSLLSMTRPGALLWATCISTVAWALECASLYVIVHGFPGVSISWDAATFAYSASTIIGALAMMPGGLGVTEVGMTGLLQALGGPHMTAAVATATTMLVRVATLWFAVLIGALALPLHRALVKKP